MGWGDLTLLLGTGLGLFVLLQPRLIRWPLWRATVTPLASIIGSGFLVSGPILAHASGRWAWAAMLGLCLVGYLYGSAMRHNILFVEPQLAGKPAWHVVWLERTSELVLVAAYFISVAFYLSLLGAFALRSISVEDQLSIRALTTFILIILGLLGFFRGLKALEKIEEYSVGFKLSVIAGLILALFVVSALAAAAGDFGWPEFEHTVGLQEAQILLGLVILVQGFETSRYLGHAYSAKTRVKTMRAAQWISTGIYLVFILLATRYFTGRLPQTGGETEIIDLLKPVGIMVAPLLILAAIASQLSAAVADINGAGGLLSEASSGRFAPRWGYAAAAVFAILVVWSSDIYQIITFASKAFVLYYGLQSAQAVAAIVRGRSEVGLWRAFVYGGGAVLAVLVIVFAVPAGV